MTPPVSSPARTVRASTLACGAIPVLILALLTTSDHIPFTDINLTVPYAAEGPGPIFNTLGEVDGEKVIDIVGQQEDQTAGEMNMTTVSVRTNMSLATAMGRWLFTNDTIVPIEHVIRPNQTPEEMEEENKSAFAASESAATMAAMNYLHRPVKTMVSEVVDNSPAAGVLHADDEITAIDGTHITTPGEAQEYVRTKKPGDLIKVTVLRDGNETTVPVTLATSPEAQDTAYLGILMVAQPKDVSVKYNLRDVGGPSAGMMFSLAVIDKLSPGELNGGRKVAGTGTIEEDGSVGPIGGIEHKVTAAHDAGMELFLAPTTNCREALRGEHDNMVIAKVDTIDDAIDAMANFSANKPVETCQN